MGARFAAATVATVLTVAGAAGPTPGGRPAVSGVLQQGHQLAATAGSWSGSGSIAYAYQWSRCTTAGTHCASIHGATRPTYTLVAKDVGSTLALTVRATDQTGTSPAYAALAGPIAARNAPLVATSQPTLTGTAVTGGTLTPAGGTWTAAVANTTTSWQRCNPNGRLCTPIAGATTPTYTPTAGDARHTIIAMLTAARADGTAGQGVLTVPSAVVLRPG